MITAIHYSSRFRKQLQSLLKAGGKGFVAARKAEGILEELRSSGGEIPTSVHLKRTKKGERRIAKCEKYDLGAGYRLITLRDGSSLFVSFIGSHDACDLWFKTKKEDRQQNLMGHVEAIATNCKLENDRGSVMPWEGVEEDIYERDLLSRVNEKLLRSLFKGFYQAEK
jgi:hypothetical protein